MDKKNSFNKITEEERLQLAVKLDKDLEKFVNNLPQKKYEDGWNEESWEEVLSFKILPFFADIPFCSRKWKVTPSS